MLVRSLYAYVGLGRPDLPEAFFGRALQEAIREVARRTFCLRTTLPVTIPAGGQSVSLDVPAGQSFLRVHRVTSADGTVVLQPASLPDVQNSQTVGLPRFWQASRATLYVAPIPTVTDGDVALLAEVSWVPTADLADVAMPDSAIPAITGLAEGRILAFPGEGKDTHAAAQRRAEGSAAITRLIWETFHPGPTRVQVEPYPGMP